MKIPSLFFSDIKCTKPCKPGDRIAVMISDGTYFMTQPIYALRPEYGERDGIGYAIFGYDRPDEFLSSPDL